MTIAVLRLALIAVLATFGCIALADDSSKVFADQGKAASTALMQARGSNTRTIDFEVREGTNISLDSAPRGDWLVFDLLGHLYRVDSKGGAAQVLTQGSGVALNITPAVSPDGRRIAFASDRSGQLNLWLMNADGSAPMALTHDQESRYVDPSWAPDGRAIAVVRRSPVRGHGVYFPLSEIWLIPIDGSEPRVLVKPTIGAGRPAEQFGAPSFSPDGKFLYFHRSVDSVCIPGLKSGRYRLRRLDLASGEVVEVRPAPAGTKFASNEFDCDTERFRTENETEPRVSPDGRWLAFTLTSMAETLSHRGHDFRPGAALMLRDLATGEERRLASTGTSLPNAFQQWLEFNPSSISWSADSKAVFHAAGGIRRVALSSGQSSTVAFRAHVHRVLSQQLRPQWPVDTRDSFSPSLLQWSSTSPDGRSVVFIAAGKPWIAQHGEPARQLIDDSASGADVWFYTPSWSPSGDEIAFASWDAKSAGHIWRYALSTRTLRQVTHEAGRYLYPVWANDGRTFAYLHSQAPLQMSPQMYESPFDEGAWNIVVGRSATAMRPIAATERPHRIAFGLDGRLRYLRLDAATGGDASNAGRRPPEALNLESIDPLTLAQRIEMQVVPVPWYWPETSLSPDGKWVSLLVSSRLFACEMSKLEGTPLRLDIGRAAGFDGCQRLDHRGAWFSSWREAQTVEFTEGSSQISVDVVTGERIARPVSVSLQRPKHRDLLLRNATLIPLDGKQRSVRGDISIVDRRIACVGKCSATPATQVIDASGKFIMPGFIDTHDHTTRVPSDITYPGEWKARASLAYGVTTRYDPFSRTRSTFPLADLTETGRLVGPRTYASADAINATVPGGGPVLYFDYEWPLTTAADAEFEVAWRARLGTPVLKYYWPWSRAQDQLVLSAARANGHVGVTSEGLSIHQELSWVMDGQTMFEHTLAGLPVHADVTQFLGMAGIVYTPTLIVEAADRLRSDAQLLAETNYESFSSAQIVQRYMQFSRMHVVPGPQELAGAIQAEAARDIASHGGRVSVGSHGELPGLGVHGEIWILSEAMGPLEALRAATINGAYKLGMSADLGSIEVGKVGDLIVLDADPLENIRNTIRIHSIVLGGAVYAQDRLRSMH